MKAWVYQRGPSWYVGWYEPGRKRRQKSYGEGLAGKKLAEKEAERIHAELVTDTYGANSNKTWLEFREEYDATILPGLSARTQEEILTAFRHFQELIQPKKMCKIATATIDAYTAKRRAARGKQPGSKASPATINKELRHLRSAFRKAKKWGYLKDVPDFDMQRVPESLRDYVSPEHFAKLYEACDHADKPIGLPYPPSEWWRAIITAAYMTGWRIGELRALKRHDLDLDAGHAITRAADNKGKRDELVELHPCVIEHLKRIPGFSEEVFPWTENKRKLYDELHRLQKLAGIPAYGFHALRRSFATMNAEISPAALQKLMRHKSFSTTLDYISKARKMTQVIASLHVPDVLKKAIGE